MAYTRSVNTNFWKDGYVVDLDPTEKLVFLYLLTNPQANIAGIYELTIREMAFDTGIDKDMLVKILERFANDGKIIYHNGWVMVVNWVKNQRMNPSVKKGIVRILGELPPWLSHLLKHGQPVDKLSQPDPTLPELNLTKLNLNLTKLNLTEPNADDTKMLDVDDLQKSFIGKK